MGGDDYVTAGDQDALEGLGSISISVWIKPDQNTRDAAIATKGLVALGTTWVLWQDNVGSISGRTDMIAFGISNGSILTRVEGNSNIIKPGEWVHVVGVWQQSPES